ncbi:hypothetical protein CEXT_491361 [Caerostris extrusa]|uniref:Uncharacterized protein n=1 Tax=Caerostris extrusa TaxID=172846 RepID=A0AAV4SZF6_CAEEX|nr:hypothetical protein CEXT_491361 [Caerostris extrusa]
MRLINLPSHPTYSTLQKTYFRHHDTDPNINENHEGKGRDNDFGSSASRQEDAADADLSSAHEGRITQTRDESEEEAKRKGLEAYRLRMV